MRSEGYCSRSVCVCLSVKSHLTSGTSNRAINEHAYLVAYECQKICGDLPETTAFKNYTAKHERKSQLLIYRLTRGQLSPLDAQRNVRSCPRIVNDIQPCPKQCLLMLLARVGARTDSTTRAATTRGVADFRARALTCAVCAEGLHFSAFLTCLLTLGAHARGLRYLVCPSVCVCVCVCVCVSAYLNSRSTGY